MLITNHWSVSSPGKLGDYHVEFALKMPFAVAYISECYALLKNPSTAKLKAFNLDMHAEHFNIWKNDALTKVTDYGTFHMNHDPRDRSANIEIAAMCMDGSDVQVEGPWGPHPYTAAHALMHAALNARVAKLKGLDPQASFSTSVEPNVLQNGPIYVLSTHGERALQTKDGTDATVPSRGYFAYSGDGNCRWDLAALDVRDAHLLAEANSAVETCRRSAMTMRIVTHLFLELPMNNMFGLDK